MAFDSKSNTIVLEERPGGLLKAHIDIANQWKKNRTNVIVAGRQYSAAAIQVVYAKKIGVNITYRNRWGLFTPKLYFHASSFKGVPAEGFSERLIQYVGKEFASIIGNLPVNGWKVLAPKDFGIAKTSKTAKG